MLILFSGDKISVLSELHVQDSISGEQVPVAGVIGWDDEYLQSQVICNSPLIFSDIIPGSVGNIGVVESKRKSKVVVHTKFSDIISNVVIRVVYIGSNGVSTISNEYTITSTGIIDGILYIGEMFVVDSFGAEYIDINMISISSGSVEFRIATI